MDRENYFLFIWSWVIMGLVIFTLLLFITAPYGRHSRRDWGPTIPNRLGWVVMEFPSLLVSFFHSNPYLSENERNL